MVKQPLIERFVQTFNQFNTSLSSKNTNLANQQYQYLHTLYSAIDKSNLHQVSKDIAYEKLTEAYNNLNRPVQTQNVTKLSSVKTKGPYYTQLNTNAQNNNNSNQNKQPKASFINSFKPKDFLIVTVFILLIAAVIFIKPEYVGLLSFNDHSNLEQKIDYTFDKNSDYIMNLRGNPTSLKLSGQILNDKEAKVYVEHNGNKLLIFDSNNKLLVKDGVFSTTCLDTCFLENFESKEVRLIIELEKGAKLFLEKLDYTVDAKLNNPPKWSSKNTVFEVKQGGSIALDLTKYFTDLDGDELTFLSTGSSNLAINVGKTILVITPKESFVGDDKITIIASDLKDVTRVPIKIVVTGRTQIKTDTQIA